MEQTVTDSQTAARLRRAVTRLNRRLRASSLGGVTPAQASLLALVDSLDNPSLGDLAAAEQIQPPSVTRLIRAMQAQDLVVCVTDAEDRRCTRVRLTARGRREITAIRQRKTAFLERRLQALTAQERERASEVASFLELLLEEE
ncbi:MAG: MarR family winged helix-turn-helix transcriptional regulator [Acidimicrobiales bacterium]